MLILMHTLVLMYVSIILMYIHYAVMYLNVYGCCIMLLIIVPL